MLRDADMMGKPLVVNGQTSSRLLPQHLDDLRRSGLSDSTIVAVCLRSVEAPATVERILGWTKYDGKLGPCLAFPFCDPLGNEIGYVRLKPE
jgi:hypothetical protein